MRQSDTKDPALKKLTPKESLFVKEYLIDLNASAACRRAGYKTARPNEYASTLLTKPNIQAEITREIESREKRLQITGDDVIEELAVLAFQNIQNLFDENGYLIPIHKLPPNVAKTISSIDVTSSIKTDDDGSIERVTKLKLWDKKGALDSMGKHYKLFTDKIENTGRDGEPLFGNINIFLGKQ